MSRSRNFWILPVEVFGISAKITALGILNRASSVRQCSMISSSVAVAPGLQLDIGDRHLAPFLVRRAPTTPQDATAGCL